MSKMKLAGILAIIGLGIILTVLYLTDIYEYYFWDRGLSLLVPFIVLNAGAFMMVGAGMIIGAMVIAAR